MKKIWLAIVIAVLVLGGTVAASVYIMGSMSLIGGGTVGGVTAMYGQNNSYSGSYRVLKVSRTASSQLAVRAE